METRLKQAERFERILRKIQMYGAVSAVELSRELRTSVVTIRKDLSFLEAQERLFRVPGGAVLNPQACKESDVLYMPQKRNEALKQAVARKAAQFIESGESLVVTAGMTPYLTLQYAEDACNLKIVTDSLMTAEEFCRRPDYQVIILGGRIDERDYFVHGQDAERQAGSYMADKAIITMDGVDAARGLTTLRSEGVNTLRATLLRARKRILVADISKIGLESRYRVEDISCVDILVTNPPEDSKQQDELKKIAGNGVCIVYADGITEEGGKTTC